MLVVEILRLDTLLRVSSVYQMNADSLCPFMYVHSHVSVCSTEVHRLQLVPYLYAKFIQESHNACKEGCLLHPLFAIIVGTVYTIGKFFAYLLRVYLVIKTVFGVHSKH